MDPREPSAPYLKSGPWGMVCHQDQFPSQSEERYVFVSLTKLNAWIRAELWVWSETPEAFKWETLHIPLRRWNDGGHLPLEAPLSRALSEALTRTPSRHWPNLWTWTQDAYGAPEATPKVDEGLAGCPSLSLSPSVLSSKQRGGVFLSRFCIRQVFEKPHSTT